MKKNNAKRTVVIIALIALMAIPSMFAYFTDTETAKNLFTVGNVDITLTETEWDAEGEDDAKNVVAGDEIAKNPVVHNVGASEAWVFIKVIEDANKSYSNIDYDLTNWTVVDNTENAKVYGYNTKLAATNGETSALFTTVTFPTDLANKAATFNIDLEAYAIQAEEVGGDTPTVESVWAAYKADTNKVEFAE